ncbi:MAG: RES family NAD+ phosphorylase [Steroidobacteraceae bacterium]
MRLYRLGQEAYAEHVLRGEGGLAQSGRWHTLGCRVVYCASVEALSVLEVRVNFGNRLPSVPYVMHTIEVPEEAIIAIEPKSLPADWNAVPLEPASQRLGADWLGSLGSLGLRVPSIHSRTDYNVLLNPLHPSCERVRVLDRYRYSFDHRLFAMPGVRSH